MVSDMDHSLPDPRDTTYTRWEKPMHTLAMVVCDAVHACGHNEEPQRTNIDPTMHTCAQNGVPLSVR